MEHLTPGQISRYIGRTLARDERTGVIDHVASCAFCQDAVSSGRREMAATADEDLNDLAIIQLARLRVQIETPPPADPDHLSEDQLLNRITGNLDPASRARIDEHLAECILCSSAVADLAPYGVSSTQPASFAPQVIKFRTIAAFASAATLAMAIVLLVVLNRPHEPQAARNTVVPAAPRNATPPLVVAKVEPVNPRSMSKNDHVAALERENHDLRSRIATLSKKNGASGKAVKELPQKIAQASFAHGDDQSIDTAIARRNAQWPQSDNVMGEDQAKKMEIEGPVAEHAISDQPVFTWTPGDLERDQPAVTYVVKVWDDKHSPDKPLTASLPPIVSASKTMSWTPKVHLPRGKMLKWNVTVFLNGEPGDVAPPANQYAAFDILDESQARPFLLKHIELAQTYARESIFGEARRELDEALQIDPYNVIALRLKAKLTPIHDNSTPRVDQKRQDNP